MLALGIWCRTSLRSGRACPKDGTSECQRPNHDIPFRGSHNERRTSFAVAAFSMPVMRLIREIFPTPVSPATTMLRIDASCILQNVLARILREVKARTLWISLSSSCLSTADGVWEISCEIGSKDLECNVKRRKLEKKRGGLQAGNVALSAKVGRVNADIRDSCTRVSRSKET